MTHRFTAFLLVATLLLTGQSCLNRNTNTNTNVAPPEKIVIKVGEKTTIDSLEHQVTTAERLDVIPASSTIKRFKNIAADKKAPEGFTYIHLRGNIKNTGETAQTIDSNSFQIIDRIGETYKITTDVTLYIEDTLFPTYIEVPAGKTTPWEGYFLVPNVGKDLELQLTDLQSPPVKTAFVNLGIANKE